MGLPVGAIPAAARVAVELAAPVVEQWTPAMLTMPWWSLAIPSLAVVAIVAVRTARDIMHVNSKK